MFVWANVTMLVVWVAALIAVRQGTVIALLPLWFTAPLVGVLGILTIRELARVTAKDRGESIGTGDGV